MFDINSIDKRYFDVTLTITGDNDKVINKLTLQVEPPKLKVMKKLISIRKAASEEIIDELAESIKKLLSKNKSHYDVPIEYVDELDFDEMITLLDEYFNWIGETKNNPN